MEQMVSDPGVQKVILVCDRKYAEKADKRSGGVGIETQIISPDIYAKQKQDKFVAVVKERDEQGNPCLPTYYKSRIFIDLSTEDDYGRNFDQLLRWIYDKPLHIKPQIGKKPAFLDDETTPALGTTVYFQRALDSIRNSRANRQGALTEYFDRLADSFEVLRLKGSDRNDFDEDVIKSVEAFLPYRNEAVQVFFALGQHDLRGEEKRVIQRFFEKLIPFMYRPDNVQSWREWDYDNFKFIVHELFLYAVACFLKSERFDCVGHLLRTTYYIGGVHIRERNVCFGAIRNHLRSLKRRNDRLGLRRFSLHADILKTRADIHGFPFGQILQADLTLFLRDCLNVLRGEQAAQEWWPETLLYAGYGEVSFEMYARARSREYFESMKCIFDIQNKDELRPVWEALKTQKLRIPQWDFDSFDPISLCQFDKMATRP